MRKAESATLVLRVRQADGSRTYLPVVTHVNGKLKPHHALVQGKAIHFPDGTYYLKSTVNGKRLVERIGSDPQLAATAKLQREHQLKSISLGLQAPIPVKPPAASPIVSGPVESKRVLRTTIANYISGMHRAKKLYKTVRAYEYDLQTFTDVVKREYLEDLTRDDVRVFIQSMLNAGRKEKTISNRLTTLRTFLSYHEIDTRIVNRKDAPRVPKKLVHTYDRKELKALLDAATPEDRLRWDFFLASACREQEIMYTYWSDLDFENGQLHIHAKPERGFQLKDAEERSVPLPPALLAQLKVLRPKDPRRRLVFPASGHPDKADGHFLRRLKEAAFAAGLNCQHCVNRAGVSCINKPVCGHWTLHTFRRTAATRWVENGISTPTVQHLLGHSNVETTMHYLGLQTGAELNAMIANTFTAHTS